MMSLYRQSDTRRARRKLFAATALVLFLFAADLLSGGKVRVLARGIGGSMWSAGAHVGSAIFDNGFFASRRALEAENASLREQLSQVQGYSAAYNALKDENESLKSIVHLADRESGITAPITSSVISSPYGTFTIGAGSQDGVMRGSAVLSGDMSGFVVGKVADVSAHTSLVQEIFSPGGSVDATIHGTSVVLSGRGAGNAYGQAPRGSSVAVGDIVRAPSLGGRAVGIVGSVQSDPAASHADIFVGLSTGISSLRFVYVIPIR